MNNDSIGIVADKRTPLGWILLARLGLPLCGLGNAHGSQAIAVAMEMR